MNKFTQELQAATDYYINEKQRKKYPDYVVMVEMLLRRNVEILESTNAKKWSIEAGLKETLDALQTKNGRAHLMGE